MGRRLSVRFELCKIANIQKPLRIVVCGATGRTGSRAAALAESDARFYLSARIHRANAADFKKTLKDAGAVVDFSAPEAAVGFAAACGEAKVPFVTGTTGFTEGQRAILAKAARKTPVLIAPNFSRGVAMLVYLAGEAARRLENWDAFIVETHHKAKKDAPSGTALRLARAVSENRRGGEVPTASLRLGGVIGEHVLSLAGPFERLELAHRADSRDAFALGALDAALWLAKQKPGLYEMAHVLGLK